MKNKIRAEQKSWGGDEVRMRNAIFKCCRIFDNSASQHEKSKYKYMDLYTYIKYSRIVVLIYV